MAYFLPFLTPRLLLICLVTVFGLLVHSGHADAQGPPPTRRDDVKEILHGVEIDDPYRWLEDQESPETRAWIKAQNDYTHHILSALPGRDAISARLTPLVKVDSISLPGEQNGRYFYTRRGGDQEQASIYCRTGLHGPEELLVDPYSIDQSHTTSVSIADVSRDGNLLLYRVRHGGADEVEIRLLDVTTRAGLPMTLPTARYGSLSIKPDRSGFYYGKLTESGPRIYYHDLVADGGQDTVVFGEGYDRGKGLGAEVSEDGRYLLMQVTYGSAAIKSEIYVQNLAEKGPILPIVNDIDARFTGEIGGDHLYLLTTWNAPDGRILAVDLKHPEREYWREIVPAGPDVIDGFSLVGGRLFVTTLHDVTSRVKELLPDGTPVREVELPARGSASAPSGHWQSSEAFYSFNSFPNPYTIYRYDVATGKQEVWARLNVPVDTSRFEVKQVFYPSRDGTKIPMFLVYKRGLKLDSARPTLITGYGGFDVSLTPSFSSMAVVWAEYGGVYAVANLRGGGEYGEKWHQAGMLEKKQNVFDDFIGAAEWLIANHYTQPDRLAIMGGSNGGLLVGAALTQRPDLFRAVVCNYPLLDMLRYQKFLVAAYWIPEYGAAEDAEQFKYLYAYSPYQHVTPGTRYPSVMFVTGDADTRVAPLHARKMAALLQSAMASMPDRPILLNYDTEAGHSGGEPLSRVISDRVDLFSYLFWQLGVPAAAQIGE